jgi:hypothetical protein
MPLALFEKVPTHFHTPLINRAAAILHVTATIHKLVVYLCYSSLLLADIVHIQAVSQVVSP